VRRHTKTEETQGQQGHDQEIEPRRLVNIEPLKHSDACFILALRFLLLLDRPVSFDGDNDLIFSWRRVTFVGFRGWKIYSTHDCGIEYRTNDMRELLGLGCGRAARNNVLILSSQTALIPTIMMPWAIQTLSPGLGQSRSREALLGMPSGQQHSSAIICSRR
jgi:hypothetical protein